MEQKMNKIPSSSRSNSVLLFVSASKQQVWCEDRHDYYLCELGMSFFGIPAYFVRITLLAKKFKMAG